MKPKETCPECGKYLRTKNFRINRKNGNRMCKQCIRRIGENKFYVPPIERVAKRITRLSNHEISFDESKRLYKKLREEGLNHQQAIRRIKLERYFVRKTQRQNRMKYKKEQSKKSMKSFLEGLK